MFYNVRFVGWCSLRIKNKITMDGKEILKEFELEKGYDPITTSDLSINQKVKRNYPESWDYWVTEMQGEDVLIRTTENEDDPKYDDFWVNIVELRLV
jgi:hypothetical protein